MANVIFSDAYTTADWSVKLALRDASTDGRPPLDLTGCNIVFMIAHHDDSGAPALRGSTATGEVSIVAPATEGVFQVRFPAEVMAWLPPRRYSVGCIISRDGETRQLFIGSVDVRNGFAR